MQDESAAHSDWRHKPVGLADALVRFGAVGQRVGANAYRRASYCYPERYPVKYFGINELILRMFIALIRSLDIKDAAPCR